MMKAIKWSIAWETLNPCKACTCDKAKQMSTTNKNPSKKASMPIEHMYLNCIMIKASKDSKITKTKENWLLMMVEYSKFKTLHFFLLKNEIIKAICMKFNKLW